MMWGVMAFTNATSAIGGFLFSIAAILLGFTLYLLLATLAVDMADIMLKMPPLTAGLASMIAAAIACIGGIWNAYNLKIKEITVTIKGLQKSVKAMHLTDTHLGHFRGPSNLQHIVNLINRQDVDVVFFTGDLLDSRKQLRKQSMDPLKELEAPVFFVEGNHDLYTGVHAIKDYLRQIGVHVLENNLAKWNELQIIGLNHIPADRETFDVHANQSGPTVQSVLASLDIQQDKPAILLHHGPSGIKYASGAGIDLFLAGHTHAGQMWPLTHLAKAIFDYNKGLHEYNGTKIYVCQGTGTFGPPMRIGTNSEMAVINLVPDH
jgi:predicted MPP superfamily phosphohydrolase